MPKVVEKKSGIILDLGCGANKHPMAVGMDKRKLEGVDIVHDLEKFPYPLKDESALTIICSQFVEHLKPWLTIDFFNECWRVLKTGGKMIVSTPYANSSYYWQDPTHCNGFTEKTFQYFDPESPFDNLYPIYSPKPWKIDFCTYQLNGLLEVVMVKRGLNEKG
jgi:SAM-dependent methyltransferase